jgi:hypothetical protein
MKSFTKLQSILVDPSYLQSDWDTFGSSWIAGTTSISIFDDGSQD